MDLKLFKITGIFGLGPKNFRFHQNSLEFFKEKKSYLRRISYYTSECDK